jgi:hypothetical protein
MKNAKAPDYTGFIEITREQIEALIADGRAGKDVKLKVGMWQYPSKSDPNQHRFFLVVEAGSFKQDTPSTGGWGDAPTKQQSWSKDQDTPF